MVVKNIEIENTSVWLTIDPIRTYADNRELIENQNQLICYFKFSKPTQFIFGQLLRNSNDIPQVFSTEEEAIDAAKKRVQQLLQR